MIGAFKYVTIIASFASLVSFCQAREYPRRWVFVSSSLRNDRDVGEIEKIVETAAQHGLNGMVLSAGLDRLDKQPPEYLKRLRQVRGFCREKGVEIIPNIFSVGYGGSVLAYNRNLAAGIPVSDVPFLVKDGAARLVPDKAVQIVNGGFEEYQDQRVKGFGFHDRPGEISFVDPAVFHSGKASMRFENFGRFEHGHARLMQEVQVQPHRCYRLSCWVKTDGLEPRDAFRIQILSADGRNLAPYDPRVPATTDWHRVVMGFDSLEFDKVRIYAGAWGGRVGRFWVDDLAIEEVALLNVLRRPGTPVTVRSESGDTYEEGKDFEAIKDERLNFRFDHEPPAIKILPRSRIKDGERLRVSYYHGMGVNQGQVSVCMSEPEVYEIWARQARLMHEHLAPAKYLLSMDEIRAGGSCEACKQRGLSMAQILGDCITKQVGILRQVNPQAEVLIWSDMLDPNHNARGDYYLVEGDYTGSWNHVPKDLTIVCWYYEQRNESLGFFSSHGFRTLAGAYYDGDTLENPRGWLEALDRTPKALGIMYTTWQDKYELLGPFGDLVAANVKQGEPFVPLFNGRNLDGWTNVNCAPETWTVRDGMIVCTGVPTGVLRSEKQYENYMLELEWRHMRKGGNGGLFVHSDPLPAVGQPFTRAIEVQIMDGNAGDVFAIQGATMTPDKPHPKGWTRALPREDRMSPQGQWNRYRVECREGMVSLAVNGTEVTRGYHANPRKGYICLESEGGEVHFRNIRIRELPGSNPPAEVVAQTDQGFRSLYNGLDLRGWKQTPGNEGHWRAKDWILDYDGKSEARGEGKHLWTEQAFGDFVLIVDWRLAREPRLEFVPVVLPDGSQAPDAQGTPLAAAVMDAGDSGIYLRGSSTGQVNIWSWPVGSGELWGYRTNITMPPEVRRAATPILNADNPPGRWNRFEITARGERVSVKLNGQVVIREAQLPGLPAKGPLALQHHGDPVQFANIYIRELKAGE